MHRTPEFFQIFGIGNILRLYKNCKFKKGKVVKLPEEIGTELLQASLFLFRIIMTSYSNSVNWIVLQQQKIVPKTKAVFLKKKDIKTVNRLEELVNRDFTRDKV